MCPKACNAGTLPTLAQIQTIINNTFFTQQPEAIKNQANPVQNTWYSVLPSTLNVRILSIMFNVGVINETIDVQLIIDGLTFSLSKNAIFSTNYFVFIDPTNPLTLIDQTSAAEVYRRAFLIEGKNIAINIRKTTNAGNGNIYCMVSFSKW